MSCHYQQLQFEMYVLLKKKIFQQLMQKHHYLGALPKIANTIWYVAVHEEEWFALLSFSAPALKCGARDQWIGWNYRHQYDRLHLIVNNSRFLIFQGNREGNRGQTTIKFATHFFIEQFNWGLSPISIGVCPLFPAISGGKKNPPNKTRGIFW